MLYSVPDLKKINDVPHKGDYNRWRAELDRIDPGAFAAIHGELEARFQNREVDTSSWIPGADWRNTPFQPIYEACQQDSTLRSPFLRAYRLASCYGSE